jgi:hypothetical protein
MRMTPLTAAIALLLPALAATVPPVSAQSTPKITIAVDARTEGRPVPEAAAARIYDDVVRGLEAIKDVQLVPPEQAVRIVWIVAGASGGPYAASLLVTERYDRETLMVIGVEDDDLAARMMALRIVNDHQIFTGTDLTDLARRIVASIDTGILARLRAVRPRQ